MCTWHTHIDIYTEHYIKLYMALLEEAKLKDPQTSTSLSHTS